MKRFIVLLLLVLLIGAGIIIIIARVNTEKINTDEIDSLTSEDHLYHVIVVIKEIDVEQKKIITEIIGETKLFNVGDKLILDMSKEYDYYSNQLFEMESEIKVYYFPYQLAKTDDITILILDGIYNEIDVINKES